MCLSLAFAALLFAASLRAADPAEVMEKKVFKDKDGKTLPYRLLTPKTEAAAKYPLVVFLHGAGERGDDNTAQLKHGVADFVNDTKHPCFIIAPQCPKGDTWADFRAAPGLTEKPTEPMRLVLALVDASLADLPVEPSRVYITGLSMGGFGTWDAISRRPEFFAAAVPICGGGDPKQAEKFAKLPLWAFHGAKDGAVKIERTVAMIEALKKAGGEPKFTEYPDVGHDSWVPAYKDAAMRAWLFDQKRK